MNWKDGENDNFYKTFGEHITSLPQSSTKNHMISKERTNDLDDEFADPLYSDRYA